MAVLSLRDGGFVSRLGRLFGRAPEPVSQGVDDDWLVRLLAADAGLAEPAAPPVSPAPAVIEPRSGQGVLGVHGVWKS